VNLMHSQTYNFSSVDSLLDANLTDVFHNKVVCMVMHNDSLIYYYHQGADTTTKGGIASATKTMSAALMLRLAQEKIIGLDDSIAKYYPVATALGKGSMTIRQLFAHTSGMEGKTNYNSNSGITLQQSADSILAFDPLIYKPIGTKFCYTGEDQQLAGAAAELAAGKGWDSLFDIKIAQPLGLSNTTFYLSSPANPRVAGGIKSNAADMMRFGQFVLHNGKNKQGIQVIDSVWMQELWIDQTNHAFQISAPYPNHPLKNNPYNVDTIYYGMGTWLDIYNPTHHYQEQISADGAFGGIIWINRCTNVTGVFMTFAPSVYGTTYHVEYEAMDMFCKALPFTCYQPPKYNLTVYNGTGSGSYPEASNVAVIAEAASVGKIFDKWTGDVSYLKNTSDSVNEITMPAKNISIIALYKDNPFVQDVIALKEKISIFPNPVTDFININFTEKVLGTLRIINSAGIFMSEINIQGNEIKIDASSLPEGIYCILIITKNYRYVQTVIKL